MKSKLLNKIWLRSLAVVAVMTTAFAGQVLGENTYSFNNKIPTTGWKVSGGSQTIESILWTYSRSTYIGGNASRIQVGSKNSPQLEAWTIQTPISSFGENKKITAISVKAYTTSTSATYNISIGGTSVSSGSLTTNSATYTANNLNVSNGSIIITLQGSSTSKAIYLEDISITYDDNTSAVNTITTINDTGITNTNIFTGTSAGTFTATVTANGNPISGATITWSSSDKGVATITSNGAVTLIAGGTTTITASYSGIENEYKPSSDTYELTVTNSDPNAPGTLNNPYSVAQALAAPESNNIYVSGIVSSVVSIEPTTAGQIRYLISDDGEDNSLNVYNGLGLNGEPFTSINDIQVGDMVVVRGNLSIYNNANQLNANNYLVSHTPASFAINIGTSEHIELFVFEDPNGSPLENGAQIARGTTLYISPDPAQGYELNALTVKDQNNKNIVATEGDNGMWSFQMPASNVTITAIAAKLPDVVYSWEEVSLADLTSNDVFVIVGNNGSNYAMTNDNGTGSAPDAIAVTIKNDKITSSVGNNIQWTVSGNATDGYTFYPNGSTTTWLYCTNSNNGVRVGTNPNKSFIIANGYLENNATERYVGIYDSQDWRCYTSNSNNIANQSFKFYKRVVSNVTITMNASGIRTYACEYDLDFSQVEGLTAYYCEGYSPENLTLTMSAVNNTIHGSGMMLKGTANWVYSVPVVSGGSTNTTNILVGLTAAETVSKIQEIDGIEYTTLILANKESNGINWYVLAENEYTLKPNSAYLRLPSSALPTTPPANLSMDFGGGSNGINTTTATKVDAKWYTLDGRLLQSKPSTKGIYVNNGHKVVIK